MRRTHRSLRLVIIACTATLAVVLSVATTATAVEASADGSPNATSTAPEEATTAPSTEAPDSLAPTGSTDPTPTPTADVSPTPVPTPEAAPPQSTHDIHIDDDSPRFDFATGAQLPEAPALVPFADAGYALLSGVRSNAYRYEIRLIASSGVEAYRGYIASAANELNAAGLASITVAAGQFTDPGSTLPANTIYIGAFTTSPCGSGGGIAGCGGPYLGQSRAVAGSGAIVLAGRVWILPPTALQSAAAQREIVAHEIGHALGLAHYSGTYAGTQQVMYPTVSTIPAYQAGDRNGLAYLRGETPKGYMDTINTTTPSQVTVTGWAFDPDQSAAATVTVTVGGKTSISAGTTVARADVRAAFGVSGNRGFSLTVPAAAGLQSICLTVTDYPAGNQQLIGCVSAILTSPQATGYIDAIAQSDGRTVTATGWVLDRDQTASSDVSLTIDGTVAITMPTNLLRSDVNTALQTSGNRGYSLTAPIPVGVHTVCVVTPDYPSMAPISIGCRTLTIVESAPNTYVDTMSQVDGMKIAATGWAFDRDRSAPSEITLTVDGKSLSTVTTTIPRADVNRAFGVTGNRGFTVSAPITAGKHTVCLLTPDYPDLTMVSFGCRAITIVDHAPSSYLDALTQSDGLTIEAKGWAFDRDANGPSDVTLTVDGAIAATAATTILRSDVNAAFATSGYRGFTLSAPITVGVHRVCLTTVDYPTLATTTISCRTITIVDHAPLGYVDAITISGKAISVIGWAFDRDWTPSSEVTLVIDGVPSGAGTTSVPRPDVDSALRTTGERGFTLTSTLDPGQHTVCVQTPNYPTNTPTTIACRTITIR